MAGAYTESTAQGQCGLDVQIKFIHEASQRSYGRPRIVHALREQHNQRVSHERVR
ncbi:hypothetical protein PT7_2469 [Pusillimonas sp. T7-7]|nr:hypothetical protein PT7_2469 [Pusillimonas sp. T7-7]